MENIVGLLSPSDLARLSCTCRYACTLCLDVAPGLDLKLYPHQQWLCTADIAMGSVGQSLTCEQQARRLDWEGGLLLGGIVRGRAGALCDTELRTSQDEAL
eukprot:883493-Pelagomonas_calceolata.AAC.4